MHDLAVWLVWGIVFAEWPSPILLIYLPTAALLRKSERTTEETLESDPLLLSFKGKAVAGRIGLG